MRVKKVVFEYSVFIIAFCLLDVLLVHILPYYCDPWTTYHHFECYRKQCSIVLHFFETPIILFNLYVAYYGLKKFSTENKLLFGSLLDNVFATNVVFFTVKCFQLFYSFTNHPQGWEIAVYVVIVTLILVTICWLLYVKRVVINEKVLSGLVKDVDGFYHPSTEEEIISLIQKAKNESVSIRCRGSAHSLSHSVYTDPAGKANRVSQQLPPKATKNINVILDRYQKLVWIDTSNGIVEVEAGIHLGHDPNDPTGRSTWENSLLGQTSEKGFTLSNLGGISHQTISGFLMTGSAGGSLKYSIEDNIEAFSMIDGVGRVQWFWKGDNHFNALLISFGIQGIISKVRIRLTKMFVITGEEKTVPLNQKCPVDLFNKDSEKSLINFFKNTSYSRLLWWPQAKVERLVIWKADRIYTPDNFKVKPYVSLSKNKLFALLLQIVGGSLFTVLKNRNPLIALFKLVRQYKPISEGLYGALGNTFMAWLFSFLLLPVCLLVAFICVIIAFLVKQLDPKEYSILARLIVRSFQSITKAGKAKEFLDYPWRSLSMDNDINDGMLSTEFTEIWVPLHKAHEAIIFFRDLYQKNSYKSTGYYATELYTARKSNVWLSPSFNDDSLRFDIFWFTNNEGDPSANETSQDGFFNQFWDGLRKERIPFTLHWGKFLPGYIEDGNDYSSFKDWSIHMSNQFPKWNEFLKLREQRDPHNIFLSNYWSLHLLGKPK